jgi:uncharacterized membrane protein YgdD (TMEM256/DUF423 family)
MAALLGGLAVALGAFGAHGLQKLTTDEKVLKSFQTAVQYQMYHALVLLVIGGFSSRFNLSLLKWAANFFILGIILFSGSLYLLALLKAQGQEPSRYLGIVTPIGGMFFLLGWITLLIAFLRSRNQKNVMAE